MSGVIKRYRGKGKTGNSSRYLKRDERLVPGAAVMYSFTTRNDGYCVPVKHIVAATLERFAGEKMAVISLIDPTTQQPYTKRVLVTSLSAIGVNA